MNTSFPPIQALAAALLCAAPTVAQQPLPQLQSRPEAGSCVVAYAGAPLVLIADKGEPNLAMTCGLHRRDGSGKTVWVEPKRVKAAFDFQHNSAVVELDLGRLEAAYQLNGNRLVATVSLSNTSDADMEFCVRALSLKTIFDNDNCEGQYFGKSWGFNSAGCKVGVFVQDGFSGEYSGAADQNGFGPIRIRNRGPRTAKHPVVDNTYLSDPGTLLAPGQTARFKVCLTFASEDAANAELFARDYAESDQKHPFALQWPDRRPLGAAFIAQSNTGWTQNPRGYIFGRRDKEDFQTKEGLAAFEKSLLDYADRCIVELKDKNAQGIIIWDLEGQEKHHAISYVGDPRRLPQIAPEMDRCADAFMKKFRDAGFKTGVTIRPTEYYEPTPGKRDWTQREVRDPVALMSEKIDYAKKRWGTTIFYLDSNVFNQDWGKHPEGAGVPWTMPVGMIQKLQEAHPDCLIIPEWSNHDYYRWSAPYSSPNIGQLTTNVKDPFARISWPRAFGVVMVTESIMEMNLGTFVDGVGGGDVLLFCCWGHSPVGDMVKMVYHEAEMRKCLPGQTEKDRTSRINELSTRDELTRYAAAKRLAQEKDAHALEVTAALLDDSSLIVRRAALDAIRAQGKVASPAVIEKLVGLLKSKDPEAKVLRQSASEALAAQGAEALPAARALLESGSNDLRLYAVRCLAQIGIPDPASAKILLELFRKPELAKQQDMRESVIFALGRMKVNDALPGLLAILETDEGRGMEWLRVAAITALGDLGDKRAIQPLINEYRHNYSNVQVYVYKGRLYEALTKLTGQKHAVKPNWRGWDLAWAEYLKGQDTAPGK